MFLLTKDEKKNFWNTQNQILLLILLIVIVVIGICAVYILSQPPSYEDTLIKAHESGASPTSLISSIETNYNAEVNLTNSLKSSSIAIANYQYSQGDIDGTEKEKKINTSNMEYQKQLSYLDNEKALDISYVNGQMSTEDLKKAIQNLKQ